MQPRVNHLDETCHMLRFVLPLLGLLAFAIPEPAEARGIPIVRGTDEALSYVATMPAGATGGKPLALCHYYETNTLYWLPFWISSNGYVLSDSDCTGQSYIDDPALIAQAFASGALDGVPQTPGFSLRERAEGHVWFGIGALILFAAFVRRRLATGGRPRRSSKMEERMEVLGLPDGPVFRFIDAMLHAANADGRADPAEIAYIREKAIEIAQLDYSAEHIEWAISNTDRLKSARDFARFGEGLTEPQARMVLRAALAVVAADGFMSSPERRFIAQLTRALELEDDEVHRILSAANGEPVPA